LIVKHLAGNMVSRWTDFLTTDGDKPTRDRDQEFILTDADTRENFMAAWERGWKIFFDTLDGLTDADLSARVLIRGEPHSVSQALLRGMSHVADHIGQITYLVRLMWTDSTWLTIPPGQSRGTRGTYRQSPEPAG